MSVGDPDFYKNRQLMKAEIQRHRGCGMYDRRKGTSTGIALQTLGAALLQPGKKIPIQDHYPGPQASQFLMRTMMLIVKDLSLVGFEFSKNDLTVTFYLEPKA